MTMATIPLAPSTFEGFLIGIIQPAIVALLMYDAEATEVGEGPADLWSG